MELQADAYDEGNQYNMENDLIEQSIEWTSIMGLEGHLHRFESKDGRSNNVCGWYFIPVTEENADMEEVIASIEDGTAVKMADDYYYRNEYFGLDKKYDGLQITLKSLINNRVAKVLENITKMSDKEKSASKYTIKMTIFRPPVSKAVIFIIKTKYLQLIVAKV